MIPESEWVWQGHAGHFIASDECRFRLTTKIGDYIISTVGDYFPQGGRRGRDTLGSGADSFYETYVFKAGPQLECGCFDTVISEWIEGTRHATAAKAQAEHMAMCRKYAGGDP